MSWNQSFVIESRMQEIMSKQAHYGVWFDIDKALVLMSRLSGDMYYLEHKLETKFDMDLEIPYSNPISRPFLKDGNYSKNVEAWYDDIKERSNVGGPFTRIRWVKLDLQKRQRVIKQLIRLGWKPTFRTAKGNPQISQQGVICPALRKVARGVGEDLSQWYVASHRKSQVKGWVDSLRGDQRLSASAIVNGTNTARMTHRLVVNVPKASPNVPYGKQMRELFTVPSNKVLIGVDAKGLELRMLCHYMNDPDYTRILLNEDIHTHNQGLANLPNRDAAKTFIYALIYGAGSTKLGTIVGGSSRDGTKIKQKFLRNLPALETLIDRVGAAAEKKGYLVGIDGRHVFMRQDSNGHIATHKALNTLLQSAGSIVMKMACILFHEKISKINDSRLQMVLNMHDEFQVECVNDLILKHAVERHMLDSIKEAGEFFNLRIPLEGDVKIGTDWSQTH